MRFKELTEDDKAFIAKIHSSKEIPFDQRIDKIREKYQIAERTARKWTEKLGLTKPHNAISPQYEKAKKRKFNKKTKRFIITWAQNDTPPHEIFLRNLEAYAEYIGADIHIIAGRYKNPTSVFTDRNHDTWHSRVLPYLDAGRHDIHKYVSIMSDIKTQPTATNPMSSFESISGENSCIFGHPKIQMRTIPVLDNARPKMMMTTGACTVPNYTDTKSGKKGEFHHSMGFVVVEIKDKNTFFARQVSANDNGDFEDLYYRTSFKGTFKMKKYLDLKQKFMNNTYIYDEVQGESIVERIDSIDACILGDLHYGKHDQEVLDATHEMLGNLEPEHVVLHDVFDGYSISHHEMGDAFAQFAKEVQGTNDLRKEVNELLDGLEQFDKYKKVVIVRSNHDDFLDRWLKNGDWKKQPTPKNSLCYMEYSQILLEQYANSQDGSGVMGVIPHLINERYPHFKCLNRKEGYRVGPWELGYHGDVGSNGSRGSILQFRKLNTKVVVGHYHSPSRYDGALAVGTSTKLKVGYNEGGASSWLQSHVIIHKSGKAQHIHFINGQYTTFV